MFSKPKAPVLGIDGNAELDRYAQANTNSTSLDDLNPLLGGTGKPKEASWKEDFVGVIPQPKQGQKVHEWAEDVAFCLHMKGYNWPYSDTLSERVFPYLVKMFKPKNYASIPSRNLNDFMVYLLNFDRPRRKTLNLCSLV